MHTVTAHYAMLYVHACLPLLCTCLHVCFGALQWAVYVWFWVELRTVALGIQCYCCRSTLRQSSGKSRWAFHVEKIMTSLQSRPDISWTSTLSLFFLWPPVCLWLCYLTTAPTVSLLTPFLNSFHLHTPHPFNSTLTRHQKIWIYAAHYEDVCCCKEKLHLRLIFNQPCL